MLNNIPSPKEQQQSPEIQPKQNTLYNKNPNIKDIPPTQKYIPYHRDYPRNNQIRERERSRDYDHRQSFHDYQYNIKNSNINNYNNTKNKNPYYKRFNDQNNNQRYEPKYPKEQKNYNNDININRSFQPMESSKDDCLILLPKNYYNFISKDFDKLKNRLRDETKDDISNIQYDYTVPSYQEYVFRFTTYSFESKSTAIKIISEFLFDSLKKIYDNSKYLRLSFLIPDNVIGFIIGIDGKNINQIRDETNAKIEVFPQNNIRNYRKIEIAGDPEGIAGAANKIYSITKKYFYFNNPKILNRNDRDREKDRDYDIERDRNYNSYKDKGYSSYKKEYNNNYRDREYKGMYNNEKMSHNREIGYQKDYNYNRNYSSNRDIRYRHSNYEKNDYNNSKYKKLYNKESNKYNNVYENNEDSNRENRRSISSKSRSYDRKSFSDRKYDDHNSSYNEECNRGNFSENENKLEKNEEKEDGEDVGIEHVENENNEKIEKKEDINKNEEGEIKMDSDNKNNFNLSNNEENNKKDSEELNNILTKDGSDNLSKIILCLSSEEINLLNNIKNNNIWINLENEYHCTISKNTKNIDGKENSLITFNGTPKQNSLAIFQLQKYLMDQTNAQSNLENKN